MIAAIGKYMTFWEYKSVQLLFKGDLMVSVKILDAHILIPSNSTSCSTQEICLYIWQGIIYRNNTEVLFDNSKNLKTA